MPRAASPPSADLPPSLPLTILAIVLTVRYDLLFAIPLKSKPMLAASSNIDRPLPPPPTFVSRARPDKPMALSLRLA